MGREDGLDYPGLPRYLKAKTHLGKERHGARGEETATRRERVKGCQCGVTGASGSPAAQAAKSNRKGICCQGGFMGRNESVAIGGSWAGMPAALHDSPRQTPETSVLPGGHARLLEGELPSALCRRSSPARETSTEDLSVWVPLDPRLQTRKGVIICRNQSSLSSEEVGSRGGWGERAHLMKSPSARAELPCRRAAGTGRSVLSSVGRRPGGLPHARTSKLRERLGTPARRRRP